MRLHIWGIDFRRSNGDERRSLFIPPELRAEKLLALQKEGFEDLVYLATCNRIEFYTTAKDPFFDTRTLWNKLLAALGCEDSKYFSGYHYEGKSAVRHLMRVACSLESMVIGEPQILGQLKDALSFSVDNGIPVHPSLHRTFQLAFETAKRVRTETAIAEKPVSIATLGIQHLQAHENELPLTHLAVIGRSPICRIAVQWTLENRPEVKITWVNRSVEKLAEEKLMGHAGASRIEMLALDKFVVDPVSFSHMLTATASIEPLFGRSFFSKRSTERRMILDFAEPADVVASELPALTTLVQIADMKEEAERNAKERELGVQQAQIMIDVALREFCRSQKEAPLLKDFNQVEPSFDESFRTAWEAIQLELPHDCHPKVRKWAEGLVRKNLHLSREHLKLVLRKVTDPYESEWQ